MDFSVLTLHLKLGSIVRKKNKRTNFEKKIFFEIIHFHLFFKNFGRIHSSYGSRPRPLLREVFYMDYGDLPDHGLRKLGNSRNH